MENNEDVCLDLAAVEPLCTNVETMDPVSAHAGGADTPSTEAGMDRLSAQRGDVELPASTDDVVGLLSLQADVNLLAAQANMDMGEADMGHLTAQANVDDLPAPPADMGDLLAPAMTQVSCSSSEGAQGCGTEHLAPNHPLLTQSERERQKTQDSLSILEDPDSLELSKAQVEEFYSQTGMREVAVEEPMNVDHQEPAENTQRKNVITITADVHVSASAEGEFSDLLVGLKEEQDCGAADQSSFCHALSLGPVSSIMSTDVRAHLVKEEPNAGLDGVEDDCPASEDATRTETVPKRRPQRNKKTRASSEQQSDEDSDPPDDKQKDADFDPSSGPRRSSRNVKRVLPKTPPRILPSGQPSPTQGYRQMTSTPAVQAGCRPEPAIFCSNCRKDLCSGQTAYQRKGQPHLFCSSDCLTQYNRKPAKKNLCAHCATDMTDNKNSMIAQIGQSFKEFCNSTCMSGYEANLEKLQAPCPSERPIERPSKSPSESPSAQNCSVCNLNREILHEVNTGTTVHHICSEPCFNTFRTKKRLKTSCCDTCGTYINLLASRPEYLFHDGQQRRFCNSSSSPCMELYKKKNMKALLCQWCKTLGANFEMLSCMDGSGKRQSFCSMWCITSYKVDLAMSENAVRHHLLSCSLCKTTVEKTRYYCKPNKTVYTFCSPGCWSNFQRNDPNGLIYLNCRSCHNMFRRNPEVLEWQGSMYQFCSKDCCQDYKRQNGVIAMCEHCKMEKILYEKLVFCDVEKAFCSRECGLLFREDYIHQLGKFCVNCSYCRQTCPPAITEEREGRKWSFCGADCKRKYLQWFLKAAPCKTCQHKDVNLRETIAWRREIFHFCNQQCLLHFYSVQAQVALNLQQEAPKLLNSLAQGTMLPTTRSETARKAQSMSGPGATSTSSLLTKQNVQPRNKAIMCKPMLANIATTCKPEMKSQSCQTDDYLASPPLVLPIPVPVYVPLPLQMYCQYVPVSMALPLSLPVPVFLPSTLDQIVETIKELRLSMPAKADLLNEIEDQGDASPHPDAMDESFGEERISAVAEAHGYASPHPDAIDGCSGDKQISGTSSVVAEAQSDVSPHDAINGSSGQKQQISGPSFAVCSPIGEGDMLAESDRSPGEERHEAPLEPSPSAEYLSDCATANQHPSPPEQSPSIPGPEHQAMSEISLHDPLDSHPLNTKLDISIGVGAWRSWVQSKLSDTENSNEKPLEVNEDLLQCSPPQLGLGLSQFVLDIVSPRGPSYRPDGIFYLCLGIQKYLLDNNKAVNIFTDKVYVNFAKELDVILRGWLPITPKDACVSRVLEDHLWECKQLGVYSTISLLNTLMFFNTKYFGLKTVEQHLQLSFDNVRRETVRASGKSKAKAATVVCYQPTSHLESTSRASSSRKRKRNEALELTQKENPNPLRCPVTLFAFYLSKCPDSVKNSPTSIYLSPAPDCTVHSLLWYSDTPMERSMLGGMLNRIMAVKGISGELS